MNYIIYKITNIINGKIYIGQTTKSISERWKRHQYKSNCRKLSNAIKKYGKENFTIEIIEKCNNIDELNKRETFWIKEYNTLKDGYNLVTNGINKLMSEETKEKISKKVLEAFKRPEVKARLSAARKKQWKNLEYRAKMLEIKRKIDKDPEVRRKKGLASKRNWKNPEWSKNQCKLRKEQWQNTEFMKFKKKQLSSFWDCPEYKKKMSKIASECKLKQNAKPFNVYEAICIQPARRNQKAIYIEGKLVGTWENKSTCAEDLGIKRKPINSCLSNKPNTLKSYKGYLFKYVNL